MPVISVLEQQTSETLADAASRLQTKDAKIKAASLEIASLEKELAESLLKESKLTADLIKEQDTGREANARYAKLESSCEAQLKALKAKDTLIGTAEDHAKKLDVNRLKELEKAGATLSSMKSNHQSEVEAFRAELSALRGQMNVQHKDHEKEMEGARQRMQKSHEELLSENEFNHIADKTNQLNALRTELEASYTVVREKDAIYLLDFKDKHAADVTKLRLTYEKETKAALAAQKEELNGEIARTRIEADRIKEAALQSSIEETSKRRDEELIRFRENSSVQSEEMMASAKRELEKSLEGQRKELMAARDILLADRKYEEQSTLAALVETHTTLLNAVKVQSEKDMKELQRILEAESFRSDSLQRELADRQIALQSLHFNMEASDEAVRRESEAALTALKAQQKAEIKNLQSTMKGRLVEEQAAIASVRQLLELESLERIASDNRLAQLENQLAESVKTHDIEIIDTRATLNSKMAELESQSVKNKQTHANEMADLKASSESLISELEGRIASGRSDANSVSAERDDLERRIAEMEITAKKDKKAYTADIAEAKAASDVRIAELERELSCDKLAHVASVDQMKAAFKVEEEDFISKMAQERVQFCSLVNEKSDIEGILSKLRIQMLEGKAHEAELMIEKASLESRIADLECLISDDKMNTNEVMKAKNSLESLVAELESQSVKNKQTHANEMADLKASSESLISELEGRIASGRSDANSVSAERDDLERRIAEMEITAKKDKKAYTADIAEAKAASDVRMAELESQMVKERKVHVGQTAEAKTASDVRMAELEGKNEKDMKSQSVEIAELTSATNKIIAELEAQAVKVKKAHASEIFDLKVAADNRIAGMESQLVKDRKSHAVEILKAKNTSESRVAELESQHVRDKRIHIAELGKIKIASDSLLAEAECQSLKERKMHAAEIAKVRSAMESIVAESDSRLVKDAKSHSVEIAKAKTASDTALAEVMAQSAKDKKAHATDLAKAKAASDRILADLGGQLTHEESHAYEVAKAKAASDIRVAELEGQLVNEMEAHSTLVAKAKVIADEILSDLEGQLAEEKERHAAEMLKTKVACDDLLAELECENMELKSQAAQRTQAKITSDNRVADLEDQVFEKETMELEIIKAKNSLESLVAELESQSVKNKQTHANEMADLKASSESLISELEGRIASGRSDANSVSAERDDLERRIAEMEITAKKDKVIREELIAATTASDLRVNEYSCQLQAEKAYSKAVSADNAALDLKLAELERLILEGRADYENQSERIFASESKLIKMEEQARIDKVAFDDLMVEKLAVKRHMGHLESADADKAEQLKDLSAYKASSESLISELEGRIASGRSDANSVSAERDDLERRIAEMEITAKKDKKAYTADIAEAKAASDVRMAELDNKLVAALKEKRLSQDRVDNLLSQVKTGQAHTEEQKLAIDALHSRIADLECLISDDKMNTNEVMKAKNSLESLVAELEGQVKRDYKTYELEMVRARAVMDGTVSDLERQLAEEKERHTTELVKAKVASDNHLVEIKCEMNNTVKALEGSARLQLDALRCELLKEEAARQAVKIKEIVRFKDLERAAALATSEEGKAAKVATLEKDHCVALNDLRDELSEQHSRQLTQALSALHDRKELDIQAAVSAAKSEVDSELQCSSRHLVETLGQEGRDALEIQRAMLDAVRVADREKASKEIQALSFRHEEVLSAVSVEHSRALQRALEEQRGELRKAFDLLVAKKERASEIAQEDAKAIHLLERDQLLAAQRVQHVRTDNHSPA